MKRGEFRNQNSSEWTVFEKSFVQCYSSHTLDEGDAILLSEDNLDESMPFSLCDNKRQIGYLEGWHVTNVML